MYRAILVSLRPAEEKPIRAKDIRWAAFPVDRMTPANFLAVDVIACNSPLPIRRSVGYLICCRFRNSLLSQSRDSESYRGFPTGARNDPEFARPSLAVRSRCISLSRSGRFLAESSRNGRLKGIMLVKDNLLQRDTGLSRRVARITRSSMSRWSSFSAQKTCALKFALNQSGNSI